MSGTPAVLEVGDLIEIKYRVGALHAGSDELIEKWVGAEIIHSEADLRPIARLKDGQLTEIRRYMTWRRIPRA